MTDNKKIELAETIAKKTNGKIWIKKEEDNNITKLRVYSVGYRGSFCEINDDGVNVDSLNRNTYQPTVDLLNEMGIENYRR